jgi:serine/threonine-protein kinase RsbW
MDEVDMVRLSVPGSLRYRELVLSAVASACRLVRRGREKQKPIPGDTASSFEVQVLSAVGEAFNNVAIHAYRGGSAGSVEIELEPNPDGLRLRLLDWGEGYDPTKRSAPDLDELPESNMGLYIMRSCMDEVTYRRGDPPGAPNVLTLFKRYTAP